MGTGVPKGWEPPPRHRLTLPSHPQSCLRRIREALGHYRALLGSDVFAELRGPDHSPVAALQGALAQLTSLVQVRGAPGSAGGTDRDPHRAAGGGGELPPSSSQGAASASLGGAPSRPGCHQVPSAIFQGLCRGVGREWVRTGSISWAGGHSAKRDPHSPSAQQDGSSAEGSGAPPQHSQPWERPLLQRRILHQLRSFSAVMARVFAHSAATR
uniref:Interleukin-23 subunit alpha n=1 Tax=Chelydra serpentina TaxID=8475 RepID=A0A8C3T215_CHESE